MRLTPSELPDSTLTVLMSALQAMVFDIHAPQDHLTDDEWEEATAICRAVTSEVDKRRGPQT